MPAMAAQESKRSLSGRAAFLVDSALQSVFRRIGLFVGTRPLTAILGSLIFCVLCTAGLLQLKTENRPLKLWVPQESSASRDQEVFSRHFPPSHRMDSIMLEAKGGASILDKAFLLSAMDLHAQVERLSFGGDNLASLCVRREGAAHPCRIMSPLGAWDYDPAVLAADPDHMATLNAYGAGDLGSAEWQDGNVTRASALRLIYVLRSDVLGARAMGWELEVMEMLRCGASKCDEDMSCACGYESDQFRVYARFQRSFDDLFGSSLQGDIKLIQAAFNIMMVYLVLNLGGMGHKVKSRISLAFFCLISITMAGFAGHGLSSWLGFFYSDVHGVLPFVLLGIGVDDSFVVMNAFDRTDPRMPLPERLADTLAHAGVSITVTSLTDFVAFTISVNSSLPALSSFCMYAALCILCLLIMQIGVFAPMVALDARRVAAGRVDVCWWLPRAWLCCPASTNGEVAAAIEKGQRDPNQMCCTPPEHKGGHIGRLLEGCLGPLLTKRPVALAVVVLFAAWFACGAWQAAQMSVEDPYRSFLPRDCYLQGYLSKTEEHFPSTRHEVSVMTLEGDYFASQRALASGRSRLEATGVVMQDSYVSWADQFRAACVSGTVPIRRASLDAEGYVIDEDKYYAALAGWLAGPGVRFQKEVIWTPASAEWPHGRVKVSRLSASLEAKKKKFGDYLIVDASRAVEAMEIFRRECGSWGDFPGGAVVAHSPMFVHWEGFRTIDKEMYTSIGLCLLAVFVITLGLIAHPVTALLVFLVVCMAIVDILGCMNMWGLMIDSITVVQLVISVGLCVDYAAHIGHNFMLQTGSRDERVVKTLGDVGSAVLCGGISTFLGVMLLGLSKSYVFWVMFKAFFLTVILGLLHGLVLLPALLSLCGPDSYGGEKPSEVVLDRE